MKQLNSHSSTFTLFQTTLIYLRSLCLICLLGSNYLSQNFLIFISSLFPFQIWKRYLSCVINLVLTRMALLVLGFFYIETENFKFFAKKQFSINKSEPKIALKSGFIGIGTHRNIIDFFYYSYMFNPTFVRLILIVESQQKDGKQAQYIKEVNYAPLTHSDALKCALQNRGFEPIIVRSQKQLKKVKYRKMAMKTLVSQCFEELKGSIFIMLPGLKQNQHIQLQPKIANDIYQNELKFLRSGVGLKITLEQRPVFTRQYKSQVHFLLNLMAELKVDKMYISSFTFRNYRFQYSGPTYRDFIEENFFLQGTQEVNYRKISYLDYVKQMDQEENMKKEVGNG